MPWFGSQNDGNGSEQIEGRIHGSRAVASSGGTGISISARIATSVIVHNVKCALYDWDTKNLIPNGTTEQIGINTATVATWLTFDFNPVARPVIVVGKEYLICAWAGGGAGIGILYGVTTGGYQWRDDEGYVDGDYIGWPDPTVMIAALDNISSIYCTYEEEAANPLIGKPLISPDMITKAKIR